MVHKTHGAIPVSRKPPGPPYPSYPFAPPRSLATLTLLKLELYANAMFTESALGGGNHGYLALVMSPADYAAQPGTVPFVEPINPAWRTTSTCSS